MSRPREGPASELGLNNPSSVAWPFRRTQGHLQRRAVRPGEARLQNLQGLRVLVTDHLPPVWASRVTKPPSEARNNCLACDPLSPGPTEAWSGGLGLPAVTSSFLPF